MNIQYDMIDIFNNNMSTLRKTSEDDNGVIVSYMTDSMIKVIDFDSVKNQYIKETGVSYVPHSVDAIYISKDLDISFIEFKNGKISKKINYDVFYKIYDSLLLFNDITGTTVSYCRKNVNFILVYNENKNSNEQQESSKIQIAKYYSKKAKRNFVRFGLEQFEGLYFKNVFTYTESEFNTIIERSNSHPH